MRKKVSVEISNRTRQYIVIKANIEKLIKEILEYLNFSGDLELSLALVGNRTIRALNKKFRNVDKFTDVISFPFECNSQEKVTGEIVICPYVAEARARKIGNTFSNYFEFLLIHSILHLFGFSHDKEEDKTSMEALEDDIFKKVEKRSFIKKEGFR